MYKTLHYPKRKDFIGDRSTWGWYFGVVGVQPIHVVWIPFRERKKRLHSTARDFARESCPTEQQLLDERLSNITGEVDSSSHKGLGIYTNVLSKH